MIAEERLRRALRASAEQVEPSTNAYARLVERVSTERLPPRRWTEPGRAGFPATVTIALVAVAGGLALVAAIGGEGDIISDSPPPDGECPIAEPRLTATATAGLSMPSATAPVAGGLALDPVRGPELKVTSLLHVGRQTTESPWQNVRVYLDGHHRMVALLVEVRLA